jgi:serine/threonine protein kinase
MADLRSQVQQALSASHTLENELGGGGMSRVFAATETALGRKVVVKVLPPEMAEGLSVERFKREIQLAARLQHALARHGHAFVAIGKTRCAIVTTCNLECRAEGARAIDS